MEKHLLQGILREVFFYVNLFVIMRRNSSEGVWDDVGGESAAARDARQLCAYDAHGEAHCGLYIRTYGRGDGADDLGTCDGGRQLRDHNLTLLQKARIQRSAEL